MSPPYRGAWLPKLYTFSTDDMLAAWAVSVEVNGPQETPRIIIETSFEDIRTGKIQGKPIRVTLSIQTQTGVDPYWRAYHEAQDLWSQKMAHGYTQFREAVRQKDSRFQGRLSSPSPPPAATVGFRKEGTLARLLGPKPKDQG